MVRWWNVKSTTPSGITINRAWHLRQFLFALIPPVTAVILMESAKYWGGNIRSRGANQNVLQEAKVATKTGNGGEVSSAVAAFKVATDFVESTAQYAKAFLDEELKKSKHETPKPESKGDAAN